MKTLMKYTLKVSAGLGRMRVRLVCSGGFDPHIRQHSFVEIGYEIISTAILPLPLIHEGQLSVTSENMCTKYW